MAVARADLINDRNRSSFDHAPKRPSLQQTAHHKNWNRRSAAIAIAASAAISTFSNSHDAFGVTRTFTNAAAGQSWAAAANWTGAAVPTAADTAEIIDGGNIFLTGAERPSRDVHRCLSPHRWR